MALPMKLSKGSVLLLHLVAVGHVWRDINGFWVASTERNKRNVHLRMINLAHRGLIITRMDRSFPDLTDLGRRCLTENPVEDLLGTYLR